MTKQPSNTSKTHFPALATPARRALARAGYARREQFAQVCEAETAGLHGMGPRAMEQLRCALAPKHPSVKEK